MAAGKGLSGSGEQPPWGRGSLVSSPPQGDCRPHCSQCGPGRPCFPTGPSCPSTAPQPQGAGGESQKLQKEVIILRSPGLQTQVSS